MFELLLHLQLFLCEIVCGKVDEGTGSLGSNLVKGEVIRLPNINSAEDLPFEVAEQGVYL